jgi:hypothetical protein
MDQGNARGAVGQAEADPNDADRSFFFFCGEGEKDKGAAGRMSSGHWKGKDAKGWQAVTESKSSSRRLMGCDEGRSRAV